MHKQTTPRTHRREKGAEKSYLWDVWHIVESGVADVRVMNFACPARPSKPRKKCTRYFARIEEGSAKTFPHLKKAGHCDTLVFKLFFI